MRDPKTKLPKDTFYNILHKIKQLPRQGWIGKVTSSDIESVADHSFGVSFLALIMISFENNLRNHENQLDKLSILEKAILHDIGESLYFDTDKTLSHLLGISKANQIKTELY